MRYWMRAAALMAGLLAIGWGLWSLRPRVTLLMPAARLVDLAADATRATGKIAAPARATLRDDMRSVLPARVDGVTFTYRTAELAIAERATLAFAVGAGRGTARGGAIAFEIQACAGAACETVFSERVELGAADAPAWLDRRISLARFGGTRQSLFFRAVAEPPGPRPLSANPTIYAPAAGHPPDHNLILISLDTLRADHLGSYGYRRDTAPFIDETFARHGAMFEHGVAAATTTTAAHMTMFTSVPPSVHGVGLSDMQALPDWLVTLPELLRAAGFTTGAITEDAWVGAGFGFGRGFDSYVENKSPNLVEPLGQVDVTFGAAKNWLRGHRGERFFLFVHTYQVHFPYSPPAAYAGLFTDGVTDAAPPAVRDAANYDREIRFTDDTLRELFAVVRELGLDRDTVVMLTADHGEEFSEHGCIWHGPNLYREVTHVPLMLWGAGIPAGKRIAEPVGSIDVMPTMLALAGVPIPAQAMGTSLAGALAGAPVGGERPLVSEAWAGGLCVGPDGARLTFTNPGLAVRLGTRTLARYRRNGEVQYELYDLAADPAERQNRYAERPTEAAPLQTVLDAHERECQARIAEIKVRTPANAQPAAPELDDRQREKLRALGYVE